MNDTKTVVIPIETKSREFVGKVWLASNLVTKNINVILGDRRIIEKTVFDINPTFYLAMGTAPQKRDLIKRLSTNTIIGVLDSEGAPTQTDIVTMHDPECIEYIDMYFSWGEEQAEKMEAKFGRSGLDIVVTGTPEFDLLHDELKHIYAASKHTEELDDFVLVITSFATANHYNPKKRKHADSEKHKWQKAMMKSYESFVKEFVKDSDHTVVIRPHPIEDTDTYRKMFSGDDNVVVKYDGSVRYYIHKASAVVHSGSTVGIESSIMGTPTIGLNTENWYQPSQLPMDVSYETNSVSETVELVNKIITNPDNDVLKDIRNIPSLSNRIYNSYEPVSGETISQRIEQAVESSNNERANDKTKHAHTVSSKLERELYKKTISDLIKNNSKYISYLDNILPGHNPTISGQRFQMFPGMTSDEISGILDMLGVNKEITIDRVEDYSDMFRLQT
jgi:surface carbohydrate biosynthesis protein